MAAMRAWRVDELGHPSTSLHLRTDVDVPEPLEGQVRITVEAGNINFADILLCQGVYQERPGVPLTPGLETGRINAVGQGWPCYWHTYRWHGCPSVRGLCRTSSCEGSHGGAGAR